MTVANAADADKKQRISRSSMGTRASRTVRFRGFCRRFQTRSNVFRHLAVREFRLVERIKKSSNRWSTESIQQQYRSNRHAPLPLATDGVSNWTVILPIF